MLSLNALSGAAWHNDRFGEDANPGVFIYAAIFTFYVFDYFVFERVQLYTYDLIHENLGFKLFWGGLIVYGWMFIIPLLGMAAHPDPGFTSGGRYFWLIGTPALFVIGWCISRGANMQKYTFKRWPDRKFLGLIEPQVIEAGDRKILCSGLGALPVTSTTWAKGSFRCPSPWYGATSAICGRGRTSSSSCRCSPTDRWMTTSTVPRSTAPRSGRNIKHE